MDLSNTALLFSSLLISTIGLALFVYGKKMQKIPALAVGIVMMVFPFFVPSVLWDWIIAAACLVGLFLLPSDG